MRGENHGDAAVNLVNQRHNRRSGRPRPATNVTTAGGREMTIDFLFESAIEVCERIEIVKGCLNDKVKEGTTIASSS